MISRKLIAAGAAVAVSLMASSAFADGDAKKGEKVFKKCKACHTAEQGGANKVGPNLFGVVGRAAGSIDGFAYSSAMKDSGITWDEESLDKFLTKPRKFIKGTKMSFAGLRKESQRENIIAYLSTLK